MADFPSARFHLPVIASHGPDAMAMQGAIIVGATTAAGASAVWPSANLAIYIPFRLSSPYLVKRFWWANGTAVAGTVDCGVYTADGTLLVNTTATTQSGTSTIQTVTPTAFLLPPGSYYMALDASSGSAQFNRTAYSVELGKAMGLAQQAVGSGTLPATATFATIAQAYQPLFGIANATVI